MTQQIRCPGCRLALAIPDDSPLTGLSCPRCLAPLSAVAATAIRPAASPVTETPPPPPAAAWPDRLVSVDRQAIGDSQRGMGCFWALFGLCVLGIVFAVAGSRQRSEGAAIASLFLTMILFGVLDILVIILIVRWVRRKAGQYPAHEPVEKFIKAVVLIFAFLSLAAAAWIFLFCACLGLVGGM